MDILIVGIGGALGATTRYIIGVYSKKYQTSIPLATIVVNITGSFIFGFLLGMELYKPYQTLYLFLTGGFLGAFTTFSTFSYETITLFRARQILPLFIYLAIHIFLGITLAALGFYIGK